MASCIQVAQRVCLPALILLALPAWTQDRFVLTSRNEPWCPLAEPDSSIGSRAEGVVTGLVRTAQGKPISFPSLPGASALIKPGEPIKFPAGNRPNADVLVFYDQAGVSHPLSVEKGKVAIICYWQTNCEASIPVMQEIVELQGKQGKFGFVAYPVAMDELRWTTIRKFQQQNASTLKAAEFFVFGGGKEGVSAFISHLPGIPAVFILDRAGAVAQALFGPKHGQIVAALKETLVEKP